ncbi:thioredoxin domain-containing protein [Thioalkalivibrio sp. AKL19]|uniref:thioredoxin domain-containing protein n=1 Tax=Thioalkalivibrio sp. AKL19 TaxID=1266914 RepID=UPI00040CEC20|nr:thioredoxin domain-containing protein [Thioalkalivibrio sp. AKL19]
MNRLAGASSPYLLQHADNPVDWYPWGEEALERARREDKPILLSIGYSACHWCHVMAHESFEAPDTAAVMNERFVNIKVDREERPDLDRIYQNAHMLLSQRPGGWPLTVFLTPDQVPFFAGTYFPSTPRHGLPSFVDLMTRVSDFLAEHPEEIQRQNDSLQQALGRIYSPAGGAIPALSVIDKGRAELAKTFDEQFGGFGDAPKFPHPASLEWLAWHSARHGDAEAERMLARTLDAMAAGGIFDQVGGGFCRYSVDARWMIPHFEKMLYDNGPLLALYAERAAHGDECARRVVEPTVAWLEREMRDPSGAFYSSLDADSEGEEGRFYVWDPETVQALLTEDEWAVASRVWGLHGPANFEGRWHLHEVAPAATVADALGIDEAEANTRLDRARERLLAAREDRVRPHRDEKILGAWNALMIAGLARAARALERPEWLRLAREAMTAVRERLWRDGRLYASVREGATGAMPRAYLDDHALLLEATLALLEAEWDSDLLAWATTLADTLLEDFEDREQGGFFFTARDHEALIQRPKVYADDAMAAGNGTAAQVLQKLGFLLSEPRYLEAAERTLANAGPMVEQAPLGHMSLLTALDIHYQAPALVVLRGPADELPAWQQRLRAQDAPVWTFAIPAQAGDLPAALAEKAAPETGVRAYVCRGLQCAAPVTDPVALEGALDEG